jgi:hypothetical protein
MKPRNNTFIIFFITLLFFFSFNFFSCKTASNNSGTSASIETPAGDNYIGLTQEQIADKIAGYRLEGEQKLRENKLTRIEFNLQKEGVSDKLKAKWLKAGLYYDNGKLVRIQLYPRMGRADTEEFYVKGGKVVFAFIQKGDKHEGFDKEEDGIEVYFDSEKIIKTDIRPQGTLTDDQLKIYEAVLTTEIKDLFDAIKYAN